MWRILFKKISLLKGNLFDSPLPIQTKRRIKKKVEGKCQWFFYCNNWVELWFVWWAVMVATNVKKPPPLVVRKVEKKNKHKICSIGINVWVNQKPTKKKRIVERRGWLAQKSFEGHNTIFYKCWDVWMSELRAIILHLTLTPSKISEEEA